LNYTQLNNVLQVPQIARADIESAPTYSNQILINHNKRREQTHALQQRIFSPSVMPCMTAPSSEGAYLT